MGQRGILIILEAGDGSGKATQAALLHSALQEGGHPVRKVAFPNYESDSSALIKMYLSGEFGSSPQDVNPYAASAFYAVDRYASYKADWSGFYQNGGIVLADRYTTSNMIHQGAKIEDMEARIQYLQWLTEFEFTLFGLPVPDLVLFLDMPPAYFQALIEQRVQQSGGQRQKDIHEQDTAYLERSYAVSLWLAERYGWHRIPCIWEGSLRTPDAIHQDILEAVYALLNHDE